MVGEAERAVELSKRLVESGFFVQAIRPPTVPPGRSMLRITAMSEHTEDDIDALTKAVLDGLEGEGDE